MAQVQTWEALQAHWHSRLSEDAALVPYADALIAAARPALRISRHAEKAAIGASKIGGAPDLPADMGYPKHAQLPMTFVAQLDLADLHTAQPDIPFPSQGLLSFFLPENDNDLSDCESVFYFSETDTLRRLEGPSSVDVFDPHTLSFEPELSLPEPFSQVAREIFAVPEDEKAYSFVRPYLDWHMWTLGSAAAAIQIGGYPMSARGYVLESIARRDRQLDRRTPVNAEQTTEYLRLFQTQTGQPNHRRTIWRKGWHLYWVLHQADLELGRFDRCFAHVETDG